MPVTSRDVPEPRAQVIGVRRSEIGTAADPLETGFVNETTTAMWGVWFVRFGAGFLILYTVFGSFVPIAGGWDALRGQESWWGYVRSVPFAVALVLTVVFQGSLMFGQWGAKTQLQWWYKRWQWAKEHERWDLAEYAFQRFLLWLLLYVVLLLVSSAPSTYTYAMWARPLIESVLVPAAVAIFVGSVIGDMIPEWVLVRRNTSMQTATE